jgi:hypothetical protein
LSVRKKNESERQHQQRRRSDPCRPATIALHPGALNAPAPRRPLRHFPSSRTMALAAPIRPTSRCLQGSSDGRASRHLGPDSTSTFGYVRPPTKGRCELLAAIQGLPPGGAATDRRRTGSPSAERSDRGYARRRRPSTGAVSTHLGSPGECAYMLCFAHPGRMLTAPAAALSGSVESIHSRSAQSTKKLEDGRSS